MVIGPVSAWLVWGVLALALTGAWAILWAADRGIRYLWERWRDRADLASGDEELTAEPVAALHEKLDPLPPERTWEQMTSHQLPLDEQPRPASQTDHTAATATLAAARERRAPWWEAEHRAAYESLGFDYPSGLMARVRELTP